MPTGDEALSKFNDAVNRQTSTDQTEAQAAAARENARINQAAAFAEELRTAVKDLAHYLASNGGHRYTHTVKLGRFKKLKCPTGFVLSGDRSGSAIDILTPDGDIFYLRWPPLGVADRSPELTRETFEPKRLVAGKIIVGGKAISLQPDGTMGVKSENTEDTSYIPLYDYLAGLSKRMRQQWWIPDLRD